MTQKYQELHKINNRPRKNLNYEKPVDIFFNFVKPKVAFAS